MNKDLVTMPAGYTLRALPVVDSTNIIARDIAVDSSHKDTSSVVVWGGEQLGGKGRRGRSWASPSGNLYASILLQNIGSLATASQLSFLTAVAMRSAIAKFIPNEVVQCKWPNDILVNETKICGILLECGINKSKGNWVIVGTGVNIAHHPNDTPYPVTHLNAFNSKVSVEGILTCYLEEFESFIKIWKSEGFLPIRAEWIKNGFGMNKAIRARQANEVEEHGIFIDLDTDGALILEKPDGSRITITAGDVFIKGSNDVAGH